MNHSIFCAASELKFRTFHVHPPSCERETNVSKNKKRENGKLKALPPSSLTAFASHSRKTPTMYYWAEWGGGGGGGGEGGTRGDQGVGFAADLDHHEFGPLHDSLHVTS